MIDVVVEVLLVPDDVELLVLVDGDPLLSPKPSTPETTEGDPPNMLAE